MKDQVPVGEVTSGDPDMQLIGNFLSFASRGDRVGLNQMLRDGTSPDVQDYDNRTALHLAASEGHAPIVELLLHYKANVNLIDRWQRTPLTDARLYGHRDICRILEVNGGKDFINEQPMAVRHEQDSYELNFDISELNTEKYSSIEQGIFGQSEKAKWRGTWVVKTLIKRKIQGPETMILSSKDNTLLRELRHPNILQFLGSIVYEEGMILITEYLLKGNLNDILIKKIRLELPIAVRYSLDIARGMNYLHEHKPNPIVHYHLNLRNILQDEGDHLKIGEYWMQMLYEKLLPTQENCQSSDTASITSNPPSDTKRDVYSFGFIFYQMLEGKVMVPEMSLFEPKFPISKCPKRIQQLIERCMNRDPSNRPSFTGVIETLEEVLVYPGKAVCPVC